MQTDVMRLCFHKFKRNLDYEDMSTWWHTWKSSKTTLVFNVCRFSSSFTLDSNQRKHHVKYNTYIHLSVFFLDFFEKAVIIFGTPSVHRGSIHTFPNPVRPSRVSPRTSSLHLQPHYVNQTRAVIMWPLAVGSARVLFVLPRPLLTPNMAAEWMWNFDYTV